MKRERMKCKDFIIGVANPFHKRWIEECTKDDIPFETRFDSENQVTLYKLRKPKRDGILFLRRLKDILDREDDTVCFNGKDAEQGHIFIFDEEMKHA